MSKDTRAFSSGQLIFKELFVGSLIYAVVLGFFNDYTTIVHAKSFSTIFFASIVLEFLTWLAFLLKAKVISFLKSHDGIAYKIAMFFCVWFIMFVSKSIFVWAIDLVFGENINIYGFFGILLVVASVTFVHKAADKLFVKLGK